MTVAALRSFAGDRKGNVAMIFALSLMPITLLTGMGIDYTAAATFYSDPAFKDNVDHNLNLHGHTIFEDWIFTLSQGVAITSDPLVETAQQTDQQSYSTALGTSYQINSDWSADLKAEQELRSVQGLAHSIGSSSDWTLSGGLNYQWGPGLSTGIDAGFGYNKVGNDSPDMTYEDLNGNINWQFARKFNFFLSGGVQIRQFLGSGESSLVSPTFGLGLNYHPFDFTSITMSANRGVNASFFQNEVTESTTLSLGFTQRFFTHYYFGVNAGYGYTSYQDSAPGGTAGIHGREDTRSLFGINLSRSFLKRGMASLTYSKSHNTSNSSGFSYDSDQIGVSLSYSY